MTNINVLLSNKDLQMKTNTFDFTVIGVFQHCILFPHN